ncbi:PstS family phosphate ABC transporter substrate-binding protein [Nocardiopsis dassonvillei]|uniref:PstS family phosphate ABC transporter substrate-binding protein n=1 Tax=Nocardiopsis dassonvillei TaxID=2014 RepID=UPI002010B75E|nr:PstS family phosphate ABC transporter substrate-binding protein [Nocardiopsis dassonvillei]MCK9871318.1 PstS family phosphate ABC transporter substrate-binding protein [Nocardiopsis dassonvillei]
MKDKVVTKHKRAFVGLAGATALMAALTACGGNQGTAAGEDGGLSGTVQVDGSSTVGPLSTAAAEFFQEENPGVQVTVGISGTGGGMEKFCNGELDVTGASRPMKEEEAAICDENGVAFEEFHVANDALTVVVSKENDWADCLTVEQLTAIWEPDSQITNWNQVDDSFPDEPLELFGAGTDSGTFDYFTEAINGEEGATRTDYTPSEDDNVTVQGVSGSPGGMGYFGFSYFEENADNLNAVSIDNGEGCVAPSVEAVQDGSYAPLSRPLFIYPTASALERPEALAFVEFFVAEHAQIAEDALFIPLNPEQEEELNADLAALKENTDS